MSNKLVEIKTKPTAIVVDSFIKSIADETKRKDSLVILALMEKAMNEKPVMWGSSLIGFGNVRCRSAATGREVDWFKMGFSPRKSNLSLQLGLSIQKYADELGKLGKHKTGVGCLYINKLDDINLDVLEKIIFIAAQKHLG